MLPTWIIAVVLVGVIQTGYTLPIDEPGLVSTLGPINKLRNVDWWRSGTENVKRNLEGMLKSVKANNVIFFLGDGMGPTTVTAARALKSQLQKTSLFDTKLAWDEFPYTSLSKTYNVDALTPDSAGTATAFFSGCKTNYGLIGVNQHVMYKNCTNAAGNEVKSIFHHAHQKKKWVGLVSTARVTHATPASLYAASASRWWEADSDIPSSEKACKDIASQLVEDNDFIRVVMGGGREKFLPRDTKDPEYPTKTGSRNDGRNIMKEWEKKQGDKGGAERVQVITDKAGFDKVDTVKTDYLMGLFERSHMQYELDRAEDGAGEPSIAEMTEKSINILKRSLEGYILVVEGGLIDQGHHANKAYKALTDTIAMSEAVEKALSMTDEKDTLVIVTADHSHVFTMGGYSTPDNDLLGLSRSTKRGTMDETEFDLGRDDLPYLTLGYGNGPGYTYHHVNETGTRRNLTQDEADGITRDKDFRQDATFPRKVETHGGEDVAVYARGPMSGLFHGTHEQSYIAHAVMHALGVTPQYNPCDRNMPASGAPPRSARGVWAVGAGLLVLLLQGLL